MAKNALANFRVTRPDEAVSPLPSTEPKPRSYQQKNFQLTPEAAREFDILCAVSGRKGRELAAEALNLLFAKYDRPQVA